MNVLEALKLNPYLAALSDDDLNQIADAMPVFRRADQHVFIRENERDDTLYLVVEGRVAVRRGEQVLEQLEPGAFFGLIALVEDQPRAADCIAAGEVTVAALPRPDYERLVGSSARIALAFQQTLGAQLARDFRNISDQIHRLLNAPD